MSQCVHIRADALADIEQAVDWYDHQQPGAGNEFTQSVRTTIRVLSGNPLIHRLRDRQRNVRWCYADQFPYRIVYRIQKSASQFWLSSTPRATNGNG